MEGALRKELLITPFVEGLKAANFEKVLLRDFVSIWNTLFKQCISAKFLMI